MNINDREEFGAMKADIATLKVDVKDIKQNISHFIECADNKYATKTEMHELKEEINTKSDITSKWIQWIPTVITLMLALFIFITDYLKK